MCVSLVEGQAERWDITAQGAKKGFDLASKVRKRLQSVAPSLSLYVSVFLSLSIFLSSLSRLTAFSSLR